MAKKEGGKNTELLGSFSPPFPDSLSRETWHSWGLKHSSCHGGFIEVVCRGIGQFPGCTSCWKAASGLHQGTSIVSQKNPQSFTKLSINYWVAQGSHIF